MTASTRILMKRTTSFAAARRVFLPVYAGTEAIEVGPALRAIARLTGARSSSRRSSTRTA